MDLKFRRNLPLFLLFAAIVAILVLGMGNQPIIAYTIEADSAGGDPSVTDVDLMDGISGLFGLPTTEEVDIIAPVDETSESIDSTSLTGTDDDLIQARETDANSEGVNQSTFQPDEG